MDDASPDGTAAHVESSFRGDPAVRVHVRRDERGLASAIYRGIREARGDVVVVMDSDGNHDPALLPLMVRCVEEFDVVIGSRYVLGGGMLTSRFRYWGSYAFNILIRMVLGLRIHDNLSGYLAFRPTLLRGLTPRGRVLRLWRLRHPASAPRGPRGRPRAGDPDGLPVPKGGRVQDSLLRVPLDVPRLGVPAPAGPAVSPQAATGRHRPPQAEGRRIKAVGSRPSDQDCPITSRTSTAAQ